MKLFQFYLKKIFPKRRWEQIFIFLAFLVIVPLFLLGILLMNTSQRAVKTSVLRDHKQLAIHTAGEVKEYINGPRQALGVTASILGTLHANPRRQETSIVELALRYPVFNRIVSVNRKGREIATSQLGTPFADRSNEEAFKQAKLGKPYISEIMISEKPISALTLATPIRQLGEIKGVLMAELNLRAIWDIVDSIKIGKTGKAYLIDHKGRLLSHPDKKLVLTGENPLNAQSIQDVLLGNVGSIEEVDQQGERWLTSYAPIENLNWGLVISQSANEAFAFLGIMKTQSAIIIMLSIFVTIFVSFLLARLMSRPVDTLIQATEKVSKGDFDCHLRVARRDEIGRLFRSFNIMTAHLKEKQRLEKLSIIGKAATTIAHELKNSLVSVNTYIRLLPERHKEKKFIREFSKVIPQELDSWKNMLQNMIDYSKFLQFQMKQVDVNELVKNVTTLASERLKQKGVHFIFHTKESIPLIQGNEEKLKQVFSNLIANALAATPTGKTISVSTDFIQDGQLKECHYVQVQIEDRGEGISIECLSKIFDPFYTTRDDGLGLGLSISKEIVKLHGGRIDVQSEKDQGTTFTVRLPIKSESRLNRLTELHR